MTRSRNKFLFIALALPALAAPAARAEEGGIPELDTEHRTEGDYIWFKLAAML